ncbi:MAG: 2-oxoacid:acceptor oxidoreductase family protein [Bacillota bacterium]|nr:2-oxoacid:acceptor oxidoreductase family protein [Bacillota bacterium]
MIQVKLYGLGGQGVVTGARVLAAAIALYEGKYAVAIPAYGHERRGAPVSADVMADEVPVLSRCFVYRPDFVLVFDLALSRHGVKVDAGATTGTLFVVNGSPESCASAMGCWPGARRLVCADASAIAREVLGRDIPNSPMLGLLAATGGVSLEAVVAALMDAFPGPRGEANAEAARRCYEAARPLAREG